MSARHLPVLGGSSLRADGTRAFIHPADVHGRFNTARRLVFYGLIALWAALPWIQIGGNPALFLDVERRRFYLFGGTFNAQDTWLVFFLLSGVGFSLVYVTAILGRVWCGWACPQTVFLEGIYRPIERLVEGPRAARLRRNEGGWSLDKLWRKALKHLLFLLASIFVAHLFLSYFVSVPRVFEMVRRKPAEHPEAFAWVLATTAVFYGNFSWFREQLCLVVCPYGRLQSVLFDDDTRVIGYDVGRGEPRGKADTSGAGDCVDCHRCVVVCPTGIDIRDGLKLDCIACTACIDACDEVMDKLKRPRGLVRYDSLNGLAGKGRRVLRPRVAIYTGLLLVGLLVASFAFGQHRDFEANILRLEGLPFVVDGNDVRDSFELHLVNKRPGKETFTITPEQAPGLTFVIPTPTVTLESLTGVRVPVFVTNNQSHARGDFSIQLHVHRVGAPEGEITVAAARFLGPSR